MGERGIIITGAVALLVIVGGAVAYWQLSEDDSDPGTGQQTSSPDIAPAEFTVEATSTASYRADIIVTRTSDETTFDGELLHDEQGNTQMTGTAGDDTLTTYFIDGDYITCQDDTCFALPNNDDTVVDKDQYEYGEDQLADYRESATYLGKRDCPSGTCDAWQVERDDVDATFYVTSNGRISQVTGTSDDAEYEVTYSYQDVTITRPANVQEFPLG